MRTRTVALVIVAITVVGGAIRLGTLDRQSFWFDELVTVSLLHRGFEDMLAQIPHSEATPFLYYVVAWPWTRLFGFGEVGLRSLSAVAGAAIVPVAYGAAATLLSRRAGLVAAALVAANPFLLWYAQEARAYSLFAFFGALTVFCFARALRGERRSLVGWAAAASLAVATHYFAVFLVAAEAVWLVVRSQPRRPTLVASLLPTAVLLAHIPLILEQRQAGESATQSGLAGRILGIPKDLLVGYSFPGELAGSAAAAGLALLGALLVLTTPPSRRRAAAVAGAVAAVAVAVPVALAAFGLDYVIARNMVAVVVPAAVFLAAGYDANRLGIATAATLCALSLAIGLAVAFDARYGRTDWRGAAKAVGAPLVDRAIIVTPNIERRFWKPYLRGLREPTGATVRVREIVVLGLATEGGFSTGAVHPPEPAPRKLPRGFRLVGAERTSTFALVRYQSRSGPAPVVTATLPELRLSSVQPGVFLQSRLARARRR
jgi:hypothetical protein